MKKLLFIAAMLIGFWASAQTGDAQIKVEPHQITSTGSLSISDKTVTLATVADTSYKVVWNIKVPAPSPGLDEFGRFPATVLAVYKETVEERSKWFSRRSDAEAFIERAKQHGIEAHIDREFWVREGKNAIK